MSGSITFRLRTLARRRKGPSSAVLFSGMSRSPATFAGLTSRGGAFGRRSRRQARLRTSTMRSNFAEKLRRGAGQQLDNGDSARARRTRTMRPDSPLAKTSSFGASHFDVELAVDPEVADAVEGARVAGIVVEGSTFLPEVRADRHRCQVFVAASQCFGLPCRTTPL